MEYLLKAVGVEESVSIVGKVEARDVYEAFGKAMMELSGLVEIVSIQRYLGAKILIDLSCARPILRANEGFSFAVVSMEEEHRWHPNVVGTLLLYRHIMERLSSCPHRGV